MSREIEKQKFIDLAYSKFGIKANGEITMEQAFEILDTIEEQSKPTP